MSAGVAALLDLTDRVEAAIESGDWVQARELETERRQLLEQLAAADDDGDRRAAFAALEARNRRMIGLVEHQKRRVLREAAVARSGHGGVAAYAELSGSQRAASDSA